MKIKPGLEIHHKNKKYVGEIPDKIFEEIYGNGPDGKKTMERMKKKFKFVSEKVADVDKNVSN